MRIVQVSTLYPPELNSGGTLACHRLAVALRARGHDVSVFAGSSRAHEPPLDEKDWTYEGIPVRAINVASGYGHVVHNYRNASVAERFARYLAEATPDVVHFHSIQALGADVLEAARASGAGVVVTMHDAWFVCAQQFLSRPPPDMRGCPLAAGARQCDCIPGFDHAARRAFLDRALTHVDVVLAVSPFLAGILEANGVAPGKIRVCENGLPPPTPLPRVPSRRLRFGYLGGGHAWKGLGTLVSAVRELERDVVVDLYGVEREDWRVQAGGVELPRGVRLLPRFGPEDLPRMLARLDVVVVPSLVVESFSLVTREALQYGVPVIVSRSGGPESVVRDGENGLLFDRGDARGLRDAMRRFADDPGLLERTRRAAGQTPIATVEQQAEHVAEVYAEVATPRPPRARPLPRSVLFVAGMEGAPFRYRVGHLAAALRDAGVRVETRLYHDEEVLGLAGEHEIVVLNRVPWDPYVSRVVARARQAGAVVVFGVDDLIFDPELDIPALHVLPRDVVERYRAGVKLFRATLDEADAFLGSTPALADAARALGKRALVVPNTLDPELVARSDAARTRAADAR
ncbi:MAG TPA: glycosyltransferase, partial [Anaeromyxobacteraceae bacterium]|nr:glycosyltransferase [Anaeromyxobacteraceae bacterium]